MSNRRREFSGLGPSQRAYLRGKAKERRRNKQIAYNRSLAELSDARSRVYLDKQVEQDPFFFTMVWRWFSRSIRNLFGGSNVVRSFA